MSASNPTSFFVTGIGTEVGKTVVSAVLTQALQADYWKPVQCGDLDHSDSLKIRSLVRNTHSVIHPEAYRLKAPMSPHAAAELEGIRIDMERIREPESRNEVLVIEGAGGLMVPLNEKDCIVDWVALRALPLILVSRNYLGSINHTLLSIHALKQRHLTVAGLIFNGPDTPTTQDIIISMSGVPVIGRLEQLPELNQDSIAEQARKFEPRLRQLLLPDRKNAIKKYL